MLSLWLQVLGLYLLTHLALTFNPYHMKEDKHPRVCLVIWICQWAPSCRYITQLLTEFFRDLQGEPIQIYFLPTPPSVPKYNQGGIDQDGLSTYTSLDDCDAMFEAIHGRGAVDNNLMATGGMVSTTFPIIVPTQAESVRIRVTNKSPMTR